MSDETSLPSAGQAAPDTEPTPVPEAKGRDLIRANGGELTVPITNVRRVDEKHVALVFAIEDKHVQDDYLVSDPAMIDTLLQVEAGKKVQATFHAKEGTDPEVVACSILV